MIAPIKQGSSASSSPTYRSPAGGVPILKKIAQRVGAPRWLVLAVGTVILATGLVFLQRPWNHMSSFAQSARSWWLEPIEWNRVRGLPDIVGNINALAIQPGSSRVWIAGNRGLLAYSDDTGDHWTKLEYDALGGTFSVTTPSSGVPAKAAMFGITSRVEAAALAPRDIKKPTNASPVQQSAPPQKSDAPTANSKAQSIPNQQNSSPVQQTPASQQSGAPNPASQTANPPATKLVTVPNVVGLSAGVAYKTLDAVGLRLGGIGVSQPGIVLDQEPKAGTMAAVGSSVAIVLGQKAPPTQAQISGSVLLNPKGNRLPSKGNTNPFNTLPDASPGIPATPANWPAPDLLAIEFANNMATIYASDGRLFKSSDSGNLWKGELLSAALFGRLYATGLSWKRFNFRYVAGANGNPPHVTRVMSPAPVSLDDVLLSYVDPGGMTGESFWFSSEQAGCVVAHDLLGGAVRCTKDRGLNWLSLQPTGKDQLEDVVFAPDGKVGWVGGANGVVLWTGDSGNHWTPKTQSTAIDLGASRSGGDWWKLLPPWFYAAWAFGLLCAAIAPFAREEETPVAFIQDYAASDRPLERGDRDALDFTPLAKALSAFVRNSATKPPLTISIDGQWGSGKSSLMNLIRADLREFGFRAIWFNAWHHQKEEHLLAALLQTVRLEAVPQLWDPSGIGFRTRLIGYRLKRYWFPMMLVTGLALFLFGVDYSHSQHGHSLLLDAMRLLPAWLGGTQQGGSGFSALLTKLPSLGTLLGLAALWPVLQKLLQAFGTNPAALLATISQGNRIADLDAQTSFREKFAKEFRDVTKALGEDHQLVVFIDDLDRCRPENVRDVLEAVNFLVSSGECFVVMGLERKSVVAAVGLSLKEMAAEMAGRPKKEDDPELVVARREYASHFLDKLINLEVPIPQLDPNKARELFYASTPETANGDAKVEARLRKRARAKRAERWAHIADGAVRFAFGFALCVALVWAAYNGGMKLEQFAREAAQAAPPSGPQATNGIAPPAGAPVSTPQQQSTPPQVGRNAPAPTTSTAPLPEFHPGSSSRPSPRNLSWPELGGLVLLATFAYYALVEAGKGARHDSPKFVKALEIWYPLVIARQPTPRAVKRWMNRVRYLATRELPISELRSPIERFADRYAARGEAIDSPPADASGEGKEPAQTGRIPEEFAVALAAIYELEPAVLKSTEQFASLQSVSYTGEISVLGEPAHRDAVNKLLREKRDLHAKQTGFDRWDKIATYAPRFLALWPTIDIQ